MTRLLRVLTFAALLAALAAGAGRAPLGAQSTSDYQEGAFGLDGLLLDPAANYDELTKRQGILERVLKGNSESKFKNRVAEDLARVQIARGAFREAVQTLSNALDSSPNPDLREVLANLLWNAASRCGDPALFRSAAGVLVNRAPKNPHAERIRKGLPFLDTIGKPPKKLVANDVKGNPVDLASLKGKFVWVCFWETGSDACAQEFPNIVGLRRDNEQNTDLVILTVAKGGAREQVDAFLAQQSADGITHIHDDKGDISKAWGVKSTPVSFIIDESGKVRFADESDAGVRDLLKDLAVRKKVQAGKK